MSPRPLYRTRDFFLVFREGGAHLKECKLGFLGPQGTHSEEVALFLQKESPQITWKLKPFQSIYDAICAVDNHEVDKVIVPVENSIEGAINITLDTLAHDVDLQIEREIAWMVHNQLMAKDPNEKITTIISHAQPLAQCRTYIKEHYQDVEIRQVSSTARAAEIVASGVKGYAAICPKRAGDIYHLTTIATEIQDNNTNCTRFILLKKRQNNLISGGAKTSIICQINGAKSGSLCEVLLAFAKYEVNLTRIESRPARTGLGEYIFFLDMEGSGQDKNVQGALAEVQKKSLWMKNLGSFKGIKIDQKINN